VWAACGCSGAIVVDAKPKKTLWIAECQELWNQQSPDECPLLTGVVKARVTALPVDDAGPIRPAPDLTLLGVSAGSTGGPQRAGLRTERGLHTALRGAGDPAALGQNRRAHSVGG